MARRAQQGAVARCPWCETSLPQLAVECPACRFPLTMAAVDGGIRAPGARGTTSTATPGGHVPGVVVPGASGDVGRARVHGSRGHRLRVGAWLLGVLSVLLLLAGIGALVTTSSPGARGDREATTSLLTSLHRATDDPSYRQEVVITSLPGGDSSDQPFRVSIDQASGFWFGAARSSSGQCFLLAGRLPDGAPVGRGTLGKNEPCTAAQVRSRLEEKLVKTARP